MRKFFLLLIVILFFTNTLHAAKFTWSKIVSTMDGGTEFYIDKDSVKKVGKFHYYWMMTDYLILDKGDDPNVKSNITFNILNCKTNEFRSVTHTSFALNKARGKIDLDFIVPDLDISYFDWTYFEEKTAMGLIFKKVCKLGI
ncbi:hypothetical protein OAC19_01725 [Candidatus Pelagibacter sp.]|nr:hypothetical protein [Candidatus Pelagibacter sp.]